jgi:hypothetical protein
MPGMNRAVIGVQDFHPNIRRKHPAWTAAMRP